VIAFLVNLNLYKDKKFTQDNNTCIADRLLIKEHGSAYKPLSAVLYNG
jgi:hypothetical protein